MKIKDFPKEWKIVLFVVLGLLVCLVVFGLIQMQKQKSTDPTPLEILNQPWEKNACSILGVTFETPFKLEQTKVEMPQNVQEVVEKMEVLNKENVLGLSITLSAMTYKASIGQVSLEGGANGAINGMKKVKGIKDLKYNQVMTTKDGIPGYLQRGTFSQSGTTFAFINVGYGKGLDFCQLTIQYVAGSANGEAVANQVVQSFHLNPPSQSLP
jgi:hypothetical protein